MVVPTEWSYPRKPLWWPLRTPYGALIQPVTGEAGGRSYQHKVGFASCRVDGSLKNVLCVWAAKIYTPPCWARSCINGCVNFNSLPLVVSYLNAALLPVMPRLRCLRLSSPIVPSYITIPVWTSAASASPLCLKPDCPIVYNNLYTTLLGAVF